MTPQLITFKRTMWQYKQSADWLLGWEHTNNRLDKATGKYAYSIRVRLWAHPMNGNIFAMEVLEYVNENPKPPIRWWGALNEIIQVLQNDFDIHMNPKYPLQ